MDITVKRKETSLGIERENSSMPLLIVQSRQIPAQSPIVGPRPVGGQAAAQAETRPVSQGHLRLHTRLPARIPAESVS